jgi:hypothetical protein
MGWMTGRAPVHYVVGPTGALGPGGDHLPREGVGREARRRGAQRARLVPRHAGAVLQGLTLLLSSAQPDCLLTAYQCTRSHSPHPPRPDMPFPGQCNLTIRSHCTRVPVHTHRIGLLSLVTHLSFPSSIFQVLNWE